MKNLYSQIARMTEPMPGLTLATVTGTVGSTPQKAGSSALFAKDSLISGTVGGGVVENNVRNHAAMCSETGESVLLVFTLDNDISMKEDAICGGTISILVDACPTAHLAVFRMMERSLADRIPGVLITIVNSITEQGVRITRYWTTDLKLPELPEDLRNNIAIEAGRILSSSDRPDFGHVELSLPGNKNSAIAFLEPVFPLPGLVIAGAGHIGKALSHLGKMLDFEVTVIDDRKEFANIDNLPDADHIIVKDIGEAIREIKKEKDTYIVIVTRGHNDDAKALLQCINSGACYIGMIGSRNKLAQMHSEFIVNKWATEDQWLKIHAPVGLEIGSKSVEEIAVSIAAQLVQVRSSGGKR